MRIVKSHVATLVAVATALTLISAMTSAGASGDHGSQDLTARQVNRLAAPLAKARAATAKYASDLELAKADGYRMMITQMIPDMGYHFLNPDITEFDVTRPPILVYVRDGDDWQLVAFEWVFPEKPAAKPLPGATYGSFPAACHYEDGMFIFENDERACSETHPETGSSFTFWHPELVTLHVWAWYPNPAGLFAGANRWIRPFNDGQV
ncbi:MAG: hypothetical protein M3N53_11725 [Actinomycetota bacterium]|nr:hypothetical protein [Actinomycetota bacterium]